MNKQVFNRYGTAAYLQTIKACWRWMKATATCNKRFAAAGIPQTVEMRRKYREMIVTTPGLNESIGGAILYDETIRQQTKDGIPMIDGVD